MERAVGAWAKGEALVEAGGFLAAEFANIPARVGRLDFVETAFFGILDAEKFDIVGPTEGECRPQILVG